MPAIQARSSGTSAGRSAGGTPSRSATSAASRRYSRSSAGGQRADEARVDPQCGVDERGVHPQQGLGVGGGVRRAVGEPPADGGVDGVDARDRGIGPRPRAEHDVEAARQGALQAAERIGRVRRVLDDAGGDHRVRRLHEQRAGAAGEDDHLAIDLPRDAAGAEQSGRLAGGGAHPNAEAGAPRGRRGSWKTMRNTKPATTPARKPPMCAMYATPPASPVRPPAEAREDLEGGPDPDGDERRHRHDAPEEEDGHPVRREQDDVRAEHAGDGSRGAQRRDDRPGVHEDLRDRGATPASR